MSIVWRLNALIAGLVVALLISFAATMLLQAAPRIRTENESIMRLAREFFLKSLDALAHSPEPSADLKALVESLQGVRHISISLIRPEAPDVPDVPQSENPRGAFRDAPEWSALDDEPLRLPVQIRGKNHGLILIRPRPSDEISEIWEAAFGVAQTGVLLSAAAFLFIGWATRRSLRPIGDLESALKRMQDGDYDVGVSPEGPSEISGIAAHVNTLATALQRARSENTNLAEKLVTAQDHERQDIARELHDELGPYLFSARAAGTALKSEAEKPEPNSARLVLLAATMLEHVEALQTTNRRVLRRLAPQGLSEVGLLASIDGMVAFWRKERPEVTIRLTATAETDALDETTTLTIYRVIQEGLTNAMKHAHPSEVSIEIAFESDNNSSGARQTMTVVVEDDGEGLPATNKPGFGLTSMRERVAALGGTLHLERRPNGGTRLSMTLRNRSKFTSITASSPNTRSAAST